MAYKKYAQECNACGKGMNEGYEVYGADKEEVSEVERLREALEDICEETSKDKAAFWRDEGLDVSDWVHERTKRALKP